MFNNVRYVLEVAQRRMEEGEQIHALVTAVKLPTGAKEIAINTENLVDKVSYILNAYDSDMYLKTNSKIQIVNIMIVWR